MRRFLLLTAVVLLSVATVSAAPLCVVTGDVTTYNGDGCAFNELLFNNFSVMAGPADVTMQLTDVSLVGSTVNMVFSPVGDFSGPIDIIFRYTVETLSGSPGILGIDNTIGTAFGDVMIIENAFDVDWGTGLVGSLVSTPGVPGFDTFAAESKIWISKDIRIGDEDSFISDFSNSVTTPEPLTFGLIGGGLLLLGLLRRRAG